MTPGRWALALAFTLLVSGCSTLNEDECRSADWNGIGFLDGSRGLPPERLAKHRGACARVGISPDVEAYTAGRDLGLELYCTPSKGFTAGLTNVYHDVCPRHLENDFLRAFEDGRKVRKLENLAAEARRQADAERTRHEQRVKRLADLDGKIEKAENWANQHGLLVLRRDLLREIAVSTKQIREFKIRENHFRAQARGIRNRH